jgi:hypothetical protein
MEQGFIMDRAHGDGGRVSSWSPGPPRWTWWAGVKGTGKLIPIGAFRCESCGYLECYARAEFAAKVK